MTQGLRQPEESSAIGRKSSAIRLSSQAKVAELVQNLQRLRRWGDCGVASFEVAEEAVADVGDVLLHGELGGGDVLMEEGLIDALVGDRGGGGGEFVRLVSTEEGLLLDVFEDSTEFAVAGGFGEAAVEAEVLFDVGETVPAEEDLFRALDAVGEAGEDFGGDVGGGDGMELEDDAEVV